MSSCYSNFRSSGFGITSFLLSFRGIVVRSHCRRLTPHRRSSSTSSLEARHQPWPVMSGVAWNAVLENYAKVKKPERDLPKGVCLLSNEKCLTIFDGYEKAKYHFLVMPRSPFRPGDDPTSTSTSTSFSNTIPDSALVSLGALRKSPHCLQVLRELEKQAEEVKDMIEEEMLKKEGASWPVQVGFHAVESMRHVHLHVISSDLISDKLKNKKHYNSFHPNLGFFLHLSDVISAVEANTSDIKSNSFYESILKRPLTSHYTGEEFPTIPKLKQHLLVQWRRSLKNSTFAHTKKEEGSKKRKEEKEDEVDEVDPREGSAKKVKVDVAEGGKMDHD